jgi:hypothetical protein
MDVYEIVINAALLFILIIVADYVWTVIHEFAHLIAAKATCGVDWWTMKVLPCKLNGEKVGGYMQYLPTKPLTKKVEAFISLAPLIISTLCCMILPIAIETRSLIFIAFILAGVFDHFGEATASNITNDLPSAAKNLNIPLWRMRLGCLSISAVSVVVSMYIYLEMLWEIY